MLLSHLLKNISHSEIKENVNITSIVSDSRQVTPGCVFVCIRGENFDSHLVAHEVLNGGAVAVIVQWDAGVDNQIIVENTRQALAMMCAEFYHNAHKNLKIIGVTGTNGKTSTTYMIKHILESSKKKSGLIGTIVYADGSETPTDADLTTPEPQLLHSMFYSMYTKGCEYCVMEVSSQALSQERCYGINFECAVFTNLSVEHLDYHKTMEEYCAAKGKLFSQSKVAIINADDKNGQHIFNYVSGKALFYSLDKCDADFSARIKSLNNSSCVYMINDSEVTVPVPGEFSVYNSLSAIACCSELGISIESCAQALNLMSGIPGRAEVIETNDNFTVMIDYAHTPEAMSNILTTVKKISPGRVVALFGCGGNRDSVKRPLMARSAVECADYVIITTDNPRTEGSNKIIEDILPGIRNCRTPCAVIPDRTYAIEYAIKNARKGDYIILCGKGHEKHQIIGKDKIPYSEREIVKSCIEKLK